VSEFPKTISIGGRRVKLEKATPRGGSEVGLSVAAAKLSGHEVRFTFSPRGFYGVGPRPAYRAALTLSIASRSVMLSSNSAASAQEAAGDLEQRLDEAFKTLGSLLGYDVT